MKCLTAKQMREVDRKIVEEIGMPSLVLMEQVAMNCYHQLLSIIDRSQKIQVVCGNGNNGGDGLAIARLLHLNHYSVSIVFVGDETALTSDCTQNMKIAKAFGVPFQELNECDIIIDAILGTGCSRKVEGKLANVIEKINKCHAKVFAIDVPSGLSSDTGQILGCAVQADITFTVGTVKCGCVVYPGKEYCGQLEVISVSSLQHQIDLIPSFYHLIDHQTMKAWLPQRKVIRIKEHMEKSYVLVAV